MFCKKAVSQSRTADSARVVMQTGSRVKGHIFSAFPLLVGVNARKHLSSVKEHISGMSALIRIPLGTLIILLGRGSNKPLFIMLSPYERLSEGIQVSIQTRYMPEDQKTP